MENIIIGIIFIFVLIFGFATINSQKQIGNPPIIPTISKVNSSPTRSSIQGTVPLPLDTDIISSFFSLIEQHRISQAVGMLGDYIAKDDKTKQEWGVQLNAIQALSIVEVVPSMKEEWEKNKHTYKVTLDIKVDPKAENAPIPYYGWENGTNIRWITLVRPGKMWIINEIGTGP